MPDVPAAGQPDKDDFLRHGGHEGDDRHPGATPRYYSTLIKKKRKFSSYIRKFRGIGCKVIYD
jgi:hypothetical protein